MAALAPPADVARTAKAWLQKKLPMATPESPEANATSSRLFKPLSSW
jgi:hypothetical protein